MKKILSLFLSVLMLTGMVTIGFSASASSVKASGKCGDNLTWEIDYSGNFTISGTGRMYNYTTVYDKPWYRYGGSIKNIVINDGVTSICDYAFLSYSITNITIPNSVTSIGDWAFSQCKSLLSITIPDSVTSIGDYAFQGCTSLTSVTIGKGVTSIGEGVFKDVTTFLRITIPDSVTYIGIGAFAYCSLWSITIPDSVTYIDDYAFDGCEWLTDVYYPGSESDWNKIYIGSYNASLTSATIHYNSTGLEDEEVDENEEIETSFGFGGTLHTNATYGLMGETVTLYGYFDTNDENFDASAALKGVNWSVNDNLAKVTSASIGYSSAAPTTTGEEKTRYEWSITVDLVEHGNAKITGTTAEGDTDTYNIVIEPELVVDAPDAIYTSAKDSQYITCTISIGTSDPNYLDDFMAELYADGVEISNENYNDYSRSLSLEMKNGNYVPSDNYKKAVLMLDVTAVYNDNPSSHNGRADVTFTSPAGQEVTIHQDLKGSYSPSLDGWGFGNYSSVNGITEEQWGMIYDMDGSNIARELYEAKKDTMGKGGVCFGMALSSALTYDDDPSVDEWISSELAYDATSSDKNNPSKSYGVTLNDYILALYTYQYSFRNKLHEYNNIDQYSELVEAVEDFENGGTPVAIGMGTANGGHELLGYHVERYNDEIRVYVYDCNYPGDNNRYITFNLNRGSITGWTYQIFGSETWSSSDEGALIVYDDRFLEASNIALTDETIATQNEEDLGFGVSLLCSSSRSLSITTESNNTVTYNNGSVNGSDSDIIPILSIDYLPGSTETVDETAAFYLNDSNTYTVKNNSTDEKVSTLYADDHSDITIYSDGRSTVTLNETNDVFNASVVPTVTDTVTMVFSTDDEKTIFEVAGITGETTNMSAVCDENQVKFSGIDAGTVTVTSGETTTSVKFDSNGGDNEYYATLSDDGSVSVELAAEVDNANNGSASNTGNTVSTGSTSSSSAKSGDSTAETASTGSASGSADESSQGSNTVSSSSGKTSPATGASIGVVALVMVVSCGAAVLTFIRRRRRNTEN